MKLLTVLALCAAVLALQGCGGKPRQPAPVEARPAVAAPAEPAAEAPPPAATTATTDPAAKPPTPTRAEFEALMAQTTVMIKGMAAAVTKSGSDCAGAAAGLERVMVDHQAFIAESKKYEGNPEVDRMAEEWMTAHMSELMEPAMTLANMSQQCASHPGFTAVMERLKQ